MPRPPAQRVPRRGVEARGQRPLTFAELQARTEEEAAAWERERPKTDAEREARAALEELRTRAYRTVRGALGDEGGRAVAAAGERMKVIMAAKRAERDRAYAEEMARVGRVRGGGMGDIPGSEGVFEGAHVGKIDLL